MNERILNCVCMAFDLSPEELPEDVCQEDIEQWDSVGTVRLVLCLEEEFGVSIEPEAARRMTNFREIEAEMRRLGVSL